MIRDGSTEGQGAPPREADAAARAEWVIDLLESMGGRDYIGEGVSQREHALQAAHFAARAGAASDEVLAALLHDVGHVCAPKGAPEMEGLGILSHEAIGAELLRRLGFSEGVAALVEGHVPAKRYLVSRTAGYLDRLSAASRRTLDFQGGPMSAVEMAAFEADPLFKARLRVRQWDEAAKEVGLVVAGVASYRALLLAHLQAAAR